MPSPEPPFPAEEAIERLERGYAAFNDGDFDTAVSLMHPEIEFFSSGTGLEIKGHDGLRGWMEPDAFESQRIEPVEYVVNRDKVLVRQRVTARGAGSGIELDTHSWSVWTFGSAGLATRLEGFTHAEEQEAKEATGLA